MKHALVEDYDRCRKPDGELHSEWEGCEKCPLNRGFFMSEEHPTFCEILTEMFEKYPKDK